MTKIGIIGGSGLDDPKILKDPGEVEIVTPYGNPSSVLTTGRIEGVEVVLVSRHGKRHQFSPSGVNYRANIFALKEQGVTHILATSACGSLREEIERGDLVVVDQLIDFTKGRKMTFHESFEDGAKHTPMAEPFSPELRALLILTARELGYPVHGKGTVVTIEGPRFSTRAESRLFRQWGADVVNMTLATEVTLANEAAIPYAAVAISTDYDCWKTDEEPVSWEAILETFSRNVEKVIALMEKAIPRIK